MRRILACLMILLAIPGCGDICWALFAAPRATGPPFQFWEFAKYTAMLIAWWAVAIWLWLPHPKRGQTH